MTGPIADNAMATVCMERWKLGNYMADVQLLKAVNHLHSARRLCTENNIKINAPLCSAGEGNTEAAVTYNNTTVSIVMTS